MKYAFRLIVLGLILGASSYLANAQGPGGRRGFDPEQFRDRMMERLKEDLKASDQEWKVIQPLMEKVMTKQRESRGGPGGMMFGMRGGPPREGEPRDRGREREGDRRGPDRMAPPPEMEALRAAVESEKTPAADLKAKMTALRESRKKSAAELTQAREELRKVLTVRQEAQLLLMGILD